MDLGLSNPADICVGGDSRIWVVECHCKADQEGKAADECAAAGDHAKALRYYVLANDCKKAIACLERLGCWDALAKRRLSAKNSDKSILCYRCLPSISPSATTSGPTIA